VFLECCSLDRWVVPYGGRGARRGWWRRLAEDVQSDRSGGNDDAGNDKTKDSVANESRCKYSEK